MAMLVQDLKALPHVLGAAVVVGIRDIGGDDEEVLHVSPSPR
jgi:hypothetical protein